MERETMDRILAAEEDLIPSSGFLASVMERVEAEATAPPPIPFPWKRALPGMVLAAGVLDWGAVELARFAVEAAGGFELPAVHFSAAAMPHLEQAGWIALAAAVSVGSWLFSRRISGRSGLL